MRSRRKCPGPNRRQFLQAGALAAATAGLAGKAWAAPAVAAKRPPNFLLIISDQLGLDAISTPTRPTSIG